MKYSYSALSLLALVACANAFPSIAAHLAEAELKKKSATPFQRLKRQLVTPPFDAASQYISTSGDYAFVAPGEGDQRGPCPGLNAMANHGYLPHNGVATIDEFIAGTNYVFGMGDDLSTFLAVYGAVADGNGLEWSIGGPTANVPSLLGLGEPEGISGSHNKYESDASPTRGDLYEYGNDYTVQVSQFQQFYDMGQPANSYTLDTLTQFRASRFQQSIENNPEFFYGPFSGVIVSPAAYTFIYRFMANKSAEYPEGLLDGDVLKSFFSITGDSGDFTYTPGYERIPDNWYTRNQADAYTIPFFATDAIAAILEYPEFAIPGGNTGTENSYIGLDPSDLSGGVISADNLLTGDNAFCLAYQAAVQLLPDTLEGVVEDVATSVTSLASTFSTAFESLTCPQIEDVQISQFDAYPGFTATYGDVSKRAKKSKKRSFKAMRA